MDLTTTTRVGNLVAPGQTINAANTTILAQLITSVSARAEKLMDRVVLVGSQTEYHSVEPGQRLFGFRAWPVSAVTSVHYDTEQAWASAALIDADNYASPVYSGSGLLVLDYAPNPMTAQATAFNSLKAIYTGGMAATAAAFITSYPDIAAAVDAQVGFEYHARNIQGMASVSGAAGGISVSTEAWLPSTLAVLLSHRRNGA